MALPLRKVGPDAGVFGVAEQQCRPPDFYVQLVATTEGIALLELVGECDLSTVHFLQRRFEELLATTTTRGVVVDLSELTFIDARSLQVLVLAHQSFPEGVVIRNPSAQIRKILEITSLSTVVPIEPCICELPKS